MLLVYHPFAWRRELDKTYFISTMWKLGPLTLVAPPPWREPSGREGCPPHLITTLTLFLVARGAVLISQVPSLLFLKEILSDVKSPVQVQTKSLHTLQNMGAKSREGPFSRPSLYFAYIKSYFRHPALVETPCAAYFLYSLCMTAGTSEHPADWPSDSILSLNLPKIALCQRGDR